MNQDQYIDEPIPAQSYTPKQGQWQQRDNAFIMNAMLRSFKGKLPDKLGYCVQDSCFVKYEVGIHTWTDASSGTHITKDHGGQCNVVPLTPQQVTQVVNSTGAKEFLEKIANVQYHLKEAYPDPKALEKRLPMQENAMGNKYAQRYGGIQEAPKNKTRFRDAKMIEDGRTPIKEYG